MANISRQIINIEGFNAEETEQFIEIVKTIFKDNMVFLYRGINFENAVNRAGYYQINKKTKLLLELAAINQFYNDEIQPQIENDKIIFTEKYYDNLILELPEIKFVGELKRSINYFKQQEPILTLIKKDESNQAVDWLALKEPHRCKVIKNVNRQEVLTHLFYHIKNFTKFNT